MKFSPRFTVSPAVLLAVALFALAGPGTSTEPIAESEGLDCTSCHKGRRARRLNDLGMYYELTRETRGYEALSTRFARCSTCHRGTPGQRRLTPTGRKYRWFFEDMEGIRDWVMTRHPEKSPVVSDDRGESDE